MIQITYRTTSPGEWTGIGVDLDGPQVDRNFYNVAVKLQELEDDRPQPNNIQNITTSGTSMTIWLDDGSSIGPIPLPVLQFRWRGEYMPSMVYEPLDTFMVTGVGIYSVILGHITPAEFDENLLVDGDPAYNKLFGADVAANNASLDYDMGFCFDGPLSSGEDTLWELPIPRDITIKQQVGHQAHLEIAPSTQDQAMSIQVNDIHVGTINFPIGEIWGTIDWDGADDIIMVAGDLLEVRKPADADATAATLSVIFLGVRRLS